VAEDATELNALADQYPEMVKEMIAEWQNWQKRTMPEE